MKRRQIIEIKQSHAASPARLVASIDGDPRDKRRQSWPSDRSFSFD